MEYIDFAVGIAFVLAFLRRDKRMLFILMLIRLIIDLFDLPVGLYFGGWSSPSWRKPSSGKGCLVFPRGLDI